MSRLERMRGIMKSMPALLQQTRMGSASDIDFEEPPPLSSADLTAMSTYSASVAGDHPTAGSLDPLLEEYLATIPPEVYTADFDAVGRLLEDLPEDEDLAEAFFGTDLADTDRWLEAINTRLSRRVVNSYAAFCASPWAPRFALVLSPQGGG